jgi:hypothetical protein
MQEVFCHHLKTKVAIDVDVTDQFINRADLTPLGLNQQKSI